MLVLVLLRHAEAAWSNSKYYLQDQPAGQSRGYRLTVLPWAPIGAHSKTSEANNLPKFQQKSTVRKTLDATASCAPEASLNPFSLHLAQVITAGHAVNSPANELAAECIYRYNLGPTRSFPVFDQNHVQESWPVHALDARHLNIGRRTRSRNPGNKHW